MSSEGDERPPGEIIEEETEAYLDGLPPPDPEKATWWILDPDQETIRKAQLPAAVELQVVRDGQAYGTTQLDRGAPAVERYQFEA